MAGKSKIIRVPGKKELKLINKALRFFSGTEFLEEFDIAILEVRGDSNRKRWVMGISKELREFLNSSGLTPHYIGSKLGEVGRRFRFCLEGTFWLVKNDRKKLWVNERGEMLFLYGRDIFASSVVRASEFNENEIVFVCNSDGDVLGIGKSRFDSERIKEVDDKRVVVENLVDRGEYLRKKKLEMCF